MQMVSALYKNKVEYLQEVTDNMKNWMEKHDFETLREFRGKLSQSKTTDPAVFERAHFMKYFK